ncbi:hypothetical protein LSAT2_028370 [Lamellibrachia satsuma]|nr:hypothetical protein LSAT2_028370 [Lamellibrachia satsuma]
MLNGIASIDYRVISKLVVRRSFVSETATGRPALLHEEPALEMKSFDVFALLLLVAIVGVSVGATTDFTAYRVCLTRCKNWYDGCKVGSRDSPKLTKTICRKQFLSCMRTCRR